MAALGKELVLFKCCSGMVLNELVRLRWMITIDNRQCLGHDVDILFMRCERGGGDFSFRFDSRDSTKVQRLGQ